MTAPVINGWFTVDEGTAHLLGTRCADCRTVYFPPRTGFCRSPYCEGEDLAEVRLPRRGTVWSYTNACYPPPAPFVTAEPYTPVTLAAVELAEAGIVVLGQVRGLTVDDLHVGMELELTAGPLADGPPVWMWTTPGAPAAGGEHGTGEAELRLDPEPESEPGSGSGSEGGGARPERRNGQSA